MTDIMKVVSEVLESMVYISQFFEIITLVHYQDSINILSIFSIALHNGKYEGRHKEVQIRNQYLIFLYLIPVSFSKHSLSKF